MELRRPRHAQEGDHVEDGTNEPGSGPASGYGRYVKPLRGPSGGAGKRIAVDLGVHDVLPYTPGQVFLVPQVRKVLDALENSNVEKIYATHDPRELPGEIRKEIIDAGYRIVKRKTRGMLYTRSPQPGTGGSADPEMPDDER